MGSRPLEEWVVWESDGYPEGVKVPRYRIWSLTVKGQFFGRFGAQLQNAPIPVACIPEDVRRSYTDYECRQSIATLEAALKFRGGKSIRIDVGDLALALGMNVYQRMNCVQAWAEFGAGALVEVTNAVRNRILEFAIAVWKEAPEAGEIGRPGTTKLEEPRVTQIFNTTVYGGSANLVGTANSSQVAFNISHNDFDGLKRVLIESGVSEADVMELKAAVESEPAPAEPGKFGPRVSAWIAAMVGKAATGAWSIGVGTAGTLLASAISKFYGLG